MFASVVGTMLEYYDFAVYGYMATVLALLFFSQDDATGALLQTIATLAVAFFLRVPGGIRFGHIGDRYGRKNALALTILLMCISTLGISLLPTYQTVGIAATVLLVLMRCLQGIAAGGELGGATSFLAESSPASRRAYFTSFVHLGSLGGSLIASLLVLATSLVFEESMLLAWAWRIPFLLGLPLAVVGLWIRSRIAETTTFETAKNDDPRHKTPLAELFRTSRGPFLCVLGLAALTTGGYYASYVYGAIYLETVGGFPRSLSYWSTVITIVVSCIVVPLAGLLSDRIGRRPVLLLSGVLGAVCALPAFWLMGTGTLAVAIAGNVLLGVPVAICLGASFAAFAELLGTRVRYTGIALGFNLSQALLGGTAAYISQWLVANTENLASPAFFYIFCAGITIFCAGITALFTVRLRETRGIELPA